MLTSKIDWNNVLSRYFKTLVIHRDGFYYGSSNLNSFDLNNPSILLYIPQTEEGHLYYHKGFRTLSSEWSLGLLAENLTGSSPETESSGSNCSPIKSESLNPGYENTLL